MRSLERRNGRLDPSDWEAFRRLAHRMLDEAIDDVAAVGSAEGPVWKPIPPEVKGSLVRSLDGAPHDLEEVYEEFRTTIAPYATGNRHPAFSGWVHGAGTPTGMVAEMLAAGLNANLGGRDHAPIYVARAVIAWARRVFGFPREASGLLVTGTSLANLIGVVVARTSALGTESRRRGVGTHRLVAYASSAVHGCIRKAMEVAGLGSDALRLVAVDESDRIDTGVLRNAIAADRAAGLRPFLIVGTAGTVDIGAFDDFHALADIARDEEMWLHVDGAFGALAMLAPSLRHRLAGLERADSLAFDFHKWAQVPYDAGCILVRDGSLQLRTF
ncbi:MAG: cytochrome D ubiquinol oxidase subunit I, partial [Candidatus Eremiobacteraeota bacterium]|nr:cytochrome D ubiquinol oxidase subunit I [Candidatus Eremiobacteraeota bacterium]